VVYHATITTPANTSAGEAKETVIQVVKGLIYRIEIEFPPGCCGLAHCQIFDGSYQLYPATPGASFHGDAGKVGFDDLYIKNAAPFSFVVKTWNLDETWEHTLQVHIGMAHTEAFMSRYMPSVSWEKFHDALAEAARRQEEIRAAALAEAFRELGEV